MSLKKKFKANQSTMQSSKLIAKILINYNLKYKKAKATIDLRVRSRI